MINFHEISSGISGLNLCALKLLLKNPGEFRAYLSQILRRYDEYSGNGLPAKDPCDYLIHERGFQSSPEDRAVLPPHGKGDGGTSPSDLLILAAVTRLLQPKRVFEIGTFNGNTTSVFLMNTPPEATVFSLDLPLDFHPPAGAQVDGMVHIDLQLTQQRKLASYVYQYQLEGRFCQLLCNSLEFDPEPYRDSIDLGFVDGAHGYKFVKNDTEKMALMMADNGLVFWHDYGGKGRFRPLSAYLEKLGERIPLYRIPGTVLAWCSAADLRSALRSDSVRGPRELQVPTLR
jgi:hypothetical protein